ncbi:transporter substrate-binding domain-containing protein, partial [Nocardia sp. NPDC060220]
MSVRKFIAAAVLAVVAATGLSACSSASDPNVLKIGTEGTYAPFSYQEGGTLTGYDVEVARAVGEKLGKQVEFVQTPWD